MEFVLWNNGRAEMVNMKHATLRHLGGNQRICAKARPAGGTVAGSPADGEANQFRLLACQMIHDYNNLLTVIMGSLEPQAMTTTDEGEARDRLLAMRVMLLQLDEMTRDFHAISSNSAVELTLVNINDLVKNVAEVAQAEADKRCVQSTTDLKSPLPAVYGSRSQLFRALYNLIHNAVEAAAADGRCVQVKSDAFWSLPEEICGEGLFVRITVTDNGHGIPKEIREKIFEPFFSTRNGDRPYKGGLGLSVVRQVVQDHGGTVHFKSEEKKGTAFFMCLPVCVPGPLGVEGADSGK